MAEELVESEDWLEKLTKELSLDLSQEETEYKRSEHEMPYDPPRDLVQGGAMDKRSLGLKDYGGTTVEPSLEKVVKKKGEQIAEWGKQGMSDLFV